MVETTYRNNCDSRKEVGWGIMLLILVCGATIGLLGSKLDVLHLCSSANTNVDLILAYTNPYTT
jgi:hypothetical protein